MHTHTNSLIHESSPYLLQHAHNPVNWYAWGNEALEKARIENKLLLISIGYSACHWCHVMEHESFEDETTAQLMNELYVCIKVDREERPDIDQVYMHAVQLMRGQGGWPLNCIALPDGRPIYGGTYFRNSDWNNVLRQIAQMYKNDSPKCIEYAAELTAGIQDSDHAPGVTTAPSPFSMEDLKSMFEGWKTYFDLEEGGPNRAPKFPMPNNYLFLLLYGYASKDNSAIKYVELTLEKLAFGGIYDQIGGGFSRYSTDILWKVPHFEKMLYDNAQLVSLYVNAHQMTKTPLYKKVVYETLEFIERELTSPEGGFYSALDADSEGEEGRFYVWKKDELKILLGDLSDLFFDYYNVNEIGFWEKENYILLRKLPDAVIAEKYDISVSDLQRKIGQAKKLVLKAREKRVRPGLDDKQITSWNALMLKAYIDAYAAFNEPQFLKAALKNAAFIVSSLKNGNGCLYHTYKNGHARINGYLEDYSFTIEAFISLYEVTFDVGWLEHARQFMTYAISHFYDADNGLFYFTSDKDPALITRKKEMQDNVIPASNSSMAKALFKLACYYNSGEYEAMAFKMLHVVKEDMMRYPSGHSNWGMLLLQQVTPLIEIAICGRQAEKMRRDIHAVFLPNKIMAGAEKEESDLPLLQGRYVKGETLIYVCKDKTCQAPVRTVEEAFELLY